MTSISSGQPGDRRSVTARHPKMRNPASSSCSSFPASDLAVASTPARTLRLRSEKASIESPTEPTTRTRQSATSVLAKHCSTCTSCRPSSAHGVPGVSPAISRDPLDVRVPSTNRTVGLTSQPPAAVARDQDLFVSLLHAIHEAAELALASASGSVFIGLNLTKDIGPAPSSSHQQQPPRIGAAASTRSGSQPHGRGPHRV